MLEEEVDDGFLAGVGTGFDAPLAGRRYRMHHAWILGYALGDCLEVAMRDAHKRRPLRHWNISDVLRSITRAIYIVRVS